MTGVQLETLDSVAVILSNVSADLKGSGENSSAMSIDQVIEKVYNIINHHSAK